jgi:hypothetical protein
VFSTPLDLASAERDLSLTAAAEPSPQPGLSHLSAPRAAGERDDRQIRRAGANLAQTLIKGEGRPIPTPGPAPKLVFFYRRRRSPPVEDGGSRAVIRVR